MAIKTKPEIKQDLNALVPYQMSLGAVLAPARDLVVLDSEDRHDKVAAVEHLEKIEARLQARKLKIEELLK